MTQYDADRNFGMLTSIEAEAIGEPGDRTFRILLRSREASGCLWVEKEQLQQIAVYIQEVTENLPESQSSDPLKVRQNMSAAMDESMEFKVARLAMGHDATSDSFLFIAHDAESRDRASSSLSFWVPGHMARKFSDESLKVCAAGRPRCFLCDKPMNSDGHVCVRSNGHQTFEP